MHLRTVLGAALAALALTLAACGGDNRNDNGFKVGTDNGAGKGGTPANEGGVGARPPSQRTTFLLSSAKGSFPNGPSRNAAVSHDQRIARYMAYESDASNIVDGDTNNFTDVFLVIRAAPYGHNGTPWKSAGTILVSKGQGGAPANGPSYRPAHQRDAHPVTHCVAVGSDAA